MVHQRLYRRRPISPNLIGSNGEVLPEHEPVMYDPAKAKRVAEHVRSLGLPVEQRPLLLGGQENGRDGREEHAPVGELVVERPRPRGGNGIVFPIRHGRLAAVHLGDGGVGAYLACPDSTRRGTRLRGDAADVQAVRVLPQAVLGRGGRRRPREEGRGGDGGGHGMYGLRLPRQIKSNGAFRSGGCCCWKREAPAACCFRPCAHDATIGADARER
uniref:Uncharacterized protein n=1 Tax=Arundo donax TaxID=35708 RepID=A0A0A9EBE2_ARUDO